jgi:type IV secretion system protein VirB10
VRSDIHSSDPRLDDAAGDPLDVFEVQPIVGSQPRGVGSAAAVLGLAVVAGGLFIGLNNHRSHLLRNVSLVTPAAAAIAPVPSAPPPPLQLAPPIPAAAPAPPEPAPAPAAPPIAALPAPAAPPISSMDDQQRVHAPTVIVDLDPGSQEPNTVLAQNTVAQPGGAVGPSPGGGAAALGASAAGAGPEDQFAQRVEDAAPARARAAPIASLGGMVPQGTIIPAVLETAIDSDLPGYTRGVVSRDVLSFDGRTVLIPRGSRLIGQYKNATALGATRAFVVWTRIIRTDGVSIQIGSPGADPLGRAGLTGDVNRHFLSRYGGSILLSVLNAGVASVARSPTTTVSIGSPGPAVGGIQPDTIAPTIKVAQGSAINIFVARDLDFSGVGPAR